MASLGYFAIKAKIVGSGFPISYRKGSECILCTFLGSYQLDNHYLGSFMIMLAVVECLSFYYKRPWWVARQMMSRASGSEVTILFDDEGIKAENPYKSYQLSWQQVSEIIETERGYILKAQRGMQYISKQALSDEIVVELNKRATQ